MVSTLQSILISLLIFDIYLFYRNKLTAKYAKYWNRKIYEYQLYLIEEGRKKGEKMVKVDIWQEDVINYHKYMFSLFTFDRDEMVSKEIVEKIKNTVGL